MVFSLSQRIRSVVLLFSYKLHPLLVYTCKLTVISKYRNCYKCTNLLRRNELKLLMFSSILMNCLTYIPGFYMKFPICRLFKLGMYSTKILRNIYLKLLIHISFIKKHMDWYVCSFMVCFQNSILEVQHVQLTIQDGHCYYQ
jgi:hypothetical protein